ncbi:hypothetical protein V5J35_002746 [Endozoicomonas sp. NE40]|uniref:Uncharacterized protein n=1 Tax=Endozoicomonas lisbonensis TaxID=3120522 RepID=A0ABV2SIF6_9GAMM
MRSLLLCLFLFLPTYVSAFGYIILNPFNKQGYAYLEQVDSYQWVIILPANITHLYYLSEISFSENSVTYTFNHGTYTSTVVYSYSDCLTNTSCGQTFEYCL